MSLEQRLRDNIARVQDRIAAAEQRAGRPGGSVTLVAVSKTQPAETIVAACAAGLRLFGENRVEEAGPKAAAVASLLDGRSAPAWHMIGHLQSRKAADILPWADMVHSVDSLRLAARLSRAWRARGRNGEISDPRSSRTGSLPILLEVNVSGEATKYGFRPAELDAAAQQISALPGLEIEGLMTMAPVVSEQELARPTFAGLAALRDDLAARHPQLAWRHLSMGMSDDFEVAIEEGATLVRIGRALFGERT